MTNPSSPSSIPNSVFDPTGLVPVKCQHGLRLHPFPDVQHSGLGRLATTWVLSRYATTWGDCIVDHGKPAPIDLVPGWDPQVPIWCYVRMGMMMPVDHAQEPCVAPHWPPYCLGSVGEFQPDPPMQPMEEVDSAHRPVTE